MTRLQRFRAYMARMNPTGDPGAAIQGGLYVAPPSGRAVADELATSLEPEPESSQLVLGGIGSGKSSAVLRSVERLKDSLPKAGDHVEYIEVSQRHDLNAGTLSGVLVALAGLSLVTKLNELEPEPESRVAESLKAVEHFAHGKTEYQDYPPGYYDNDHNDWEPPYVYPVHKPGVLVAPQVPIPDELSALIPHLGVVRANYPGKDRHAVFLFDSLDRLPSPERFREAVQHDLRVLKAAGIGVAVVGPIRFIAGPDRALVDLFDHTHFQVATDPDERGGITFLTEVLRCRAEPDVLPDECLEPLARASGGVMRDLIALAKRAGEEAYAAGNDRIAMENVTRAVDALGRSLAIGLDDQDIKKLRHLKRRGGFVIRGEAELSLLETRRVLMYDRSRFAVHPTLVPLLDKIPEAA